MILCSVCKIEKTKDNFYKHKHNKSGHMYTCKACIIAKQKLDRKDNPEKERAIRIKNVYGLSYLDYVSTFESQDGCCAICKTPLKLHKGIDSNLPIAHVDHNHQTGEVRGLLCTACNAGIGLFKDSALFLKNASEYIQDYKGVIKSP